MIASTTIQLIFSKISSLFSAVICPLVVGLVLWAVTNNSEKRE